MAAFAEELATPAPSGLPRGWFNRAEQPNKLHPLIWPWMNKIVGATVAGQGIRQRPHDQAALSFIDHDPVFVVKRHVNISHR